jgi:hypothetical protein
MICIDEKYYAGMKGVFLMKKTISDRSMDLSVIVIANLFNLVMVVVFLLRTIKKTGHLLLVGFIWVVFIAALAVIVFQNVKAKRGRWFIILPTLFDLFLIVEVVLDYIFRYEFRSTGLIGPYLLLYYVSIFGMIGYSFLVEKKYGFITLMTYFLSQFAALYSYTKVGHG